MPELLGAVALVQLRKHEALLADMRARKRMILESISGLAKRKGVVFPTPNDPEGDASVAVIFLMPEASLAQKAARALDAKDWAPGCCIPLIPRTTMFTHTGRQL